MKSKFDTIAERAGTKTLKFDLREELFGRPDVIPMWIADMDFEIGEPITQAIVKRAGHKVYGYDFGGEISGDSVLGWLRRRSGWEPGKDALRFSSGVVSAISAAISSFTDKGDGIVIQPPVYHPFRHQIENNGRRVLNNPMVRRGDKYYIDFEDLDSKLSKARAFILCNPHNPLGRVFTEEELRRMGELCVKHDVAILSDEIHSDLVFSPNHHIHIATLDPRFAQRTVTFIAPSKTFNIAGLYTSVVVMQDKTLRQRWDRHQAAVHMHEGTLFGHIAMKAAYDECEEWLEELLPYLKGNIDYVRDYLIRNAPQIKAVDQEGTYLLWMDFTELRMSQKELMKWLVEEAGLGLNDGEMFGEEGAGFARMNVATNRATVEKAMSQLGAAVSRLQTRR